ncbi:MAG TPA: OmpW family outer membrane protein [Thermoanaerobaculia bacterium]|nr:OmpW family outer membrane protein [Thermoanaerobaculia bacterium]
MTQTLYRALFLLFIVAGCLRLSAQDRQTDVGVWIVDTELNETTLLDDGEALRVTFHEQVGFGLSLNHFWTSRFSTELSAMSFGGDMSVGTAGVPEVTVGELDAGAITAIAQLHFNRAGRVSPYIGAGAAHVSGSFDVADDIDSDETLDLESSTTWTAAAGLNVRLTERFLLAGELKYVPWSPTDAEGLDSERIDIDPLFFSAGVRFRF